MDLSAMVSSLWGDIHAQNWGNLPSYFTQTATINWHNTNERFSVNEFVLANSRYPGDWQIRIEKLMSANQIVISVVQVLLKESGVSFHATSFFQFENGKIQTLDEYWSEDGPPPQWRTELKIGTPICGSIE